jgi:hypothetical protein
MPMTRDVIARVRIGNLIEPCVESYLLDAVALASDLFSCFVVTGIPVMLT